MEVEFRVHVETEPMEVVCVVGDVPQLGCWSPHSAQQLQRIQETGATTTSGEQGSVWAKKIQVPANTDLNYRYFVAYIDEAHGEKDIVITRWETNITPRRIRRNDTIENIAEFGTYDGVTRIDKSWLLGQTEIQLRLHSSPFKFWKAESEEPQIYQVKCVPIDLRHVEGGMDDDEDQDISKTKPQNRVSVAILKEGHSTPHRQSLNGETFHSTDYMVFKCVATELEFMGFKLELYEPSTQSAGSRNTPKYLGYCYVLPTNFPHTTGIRSLPIHSPKHKPIGQLAVDYLIIKPLPLGHCDMSVSYAKHWRKRRTLDIGHRGMGNSYTAAERSAVIRENTIASFKTAGEHGAEYVEFDVQLSKDLYPVIFHEFSVCLTLRKKTKDDLELFEVPVKDLTLDELQSLKTFHPHFLNDKTHDLNKEDSDSIEHQHFPTLKNLFEAVDQHVGFNVEIKYPQALKDGTHELDPFFDLNMYVDRILKDILDYGGDRRIIISCFHPDVCTMVRRKQNKHPVLYLTKGQKNQRSDIRCRTLDVAKSIAICESYLGVDLYTEELLEHMDFIERVRAAKLVLFVWGEINDMETLNMLRSKEVDAIIYDRIHELKQTKENIFKLKSDARRELTNGATPMDQSSSEQRS